ncbi:ribose-phosphate diphosphokinase [Parahaliea aestuarii]|uniref:Ribose-phosphate diphosphokinase n=1 Tax=Parahaliea aestuarii TaxID=1852021 RepID=A0A5C9A2L8_9GAMM|nr:ribose-phosphate diphosphokinase [Parahaliea aestuarii]TXS93581.1 ribose-phosphate diphosphokinase [Parahaliea aestuarii]
MALLLYSLDEAPVAGRLAKASGLPSAPYQCHRFPDQELRLTLPIAEVASPVDTLVVYRSLDRPNDKLIELLLIARHAREAGISRLLLVAPYLAYMRQDIAFHPGEVVSQRVIGAFLAGLFDAVITVDPHLHRTHSLIEAIPVDHAIALQGSPRLAELIGRRHASPLLIGPDAESRQWVEVAARRLGCAYGVCSKVRRGDRDVDITLPSMPIAGQQVVLMDDIASSGRTLARACERLLQAGALSVDVAVTHALFADDALDILRAAGVGEIWSTDCISHATNAIDMAPVLSEALLPLLS